MTKQIKKTNTNKKTNKAQTKGKQTQKGQAPKQAPESFAVALKQTAGDTKKALSLTKAQRKEYANRLFSKPILCLLENIANRKGQGGKAYSITASFPCKSDLAKLDTIRVFDTKARHNITPRQITALVIAYLMRDSDTGFSRIFPNGLFLENGCLKDLLTGGFITDKGGQGVDQRFGFVDSLKWIFEDPQIQSLEHDLINEDLI